MFSNTLKEFNGIANNMLVFLYLKQDDSERSSCTPAAKTVPFQKRSLQYSSSVPIQVPRWGAMFNKDSGEDTDEDVSYRL